LPEIQSIAVEGSQRIVLVLRVDADAFDHPVVVSGRVKIRVASSSINADRAIIEQLVDRDRGGSSPQAGGFVVPFSPENVPFWDSTSPPYATFRVTGSLQLTRQVLQRPWLSSKAIRAARQSLESSVVPESLWLRGALVERLLSHPRRWKLDWRRANDCRITVEPKDPSHWPIQALGGGAQVVLSQQTLYAVVAAWLPVSDRSAPLQIEDVHSLLLGLLLTCRDLLTDAAAAMTPAAALRWTGWTGWIQPADSSAPIDVVVDFSRWARATTGGTGGCLLPRYTTKNVYGSAFDELVREWLLLFLATNGILDHETDIETFKPPDWLNRVARP
jgi:hypothetical protein